MKHLTLVVVALLFLAVGCGSGSSTNTSSNGGTPNYTGQAQGVYSGTASDGHSFSTILLPNDKFYGIYGTVNGNQLLVSGMMTGQGTSGNDTYTASVTDFLSTGAIQSGSITASDVPGSSVNGRLTEGGTAITFNGTAPATSSFNYNTPASVSAIFGSWTGTLLDGTSTTVTINSNGTVSGFSAGCSFSGTVAADSSGKNFFDVSLTFGASPCLFPNQTASGVAVYYLLSDGVTHQLLGGVTLGTSAGTVFAAER